MLSAVFNWRNESETMISSLIAWVLFGGLSGIDVQQQQTDGVGESVEMDGQTLKLQFNEDFENGSNRWKSTDSANWAIKTTGNSNHVFALLKRQSAYQPPVRSPHNIALIRDKQFGDFVLTFDVRNPQDTGAHRDCCVFFGYQDPQHFYYVHLGHQPDPASGQIMIVNGKPRTPLTENDKKINWTSDWHKVKLTRNLSSGSIGVYFDDMQQPVMTVSDTTFGRGQVGLGSFDDVNHFDNVRIYAR